MKLACMGKGAVLKICREGTFLWSRLHTFMYALKKDRIAFLCLTGKKSSRRKIGAAKTNGAKNDLFRIYTRTCSPTNSIVLYTYTIHTNRLYTHTYISSCRLKLAICLFF